MFPAKVGVGLNKSTQFSRFVFEIGAFNSSHSKRQPSNFFVHFRTHLSKLVAKKTKNKNKKKQNQNLKNTKSIRLRRFALWPQQAHIPSSFVSCLDADRNGNHTTIRVTISGKSLRTNVTRHVQKPFVRFEPTFRTFEMCIRSIVLAGIHLSSSCASISPSCNCTSALFKPDGQ